MIRRPPRSTLFPTRRSPDLLPRMDVASSRDQPEKVYVQHRLWERRAALWAWLQEGAVLYLCGDATSMAKDVEATLRRVAIDRKSTRLNSSHANISYAVFCLKKKKLEKTKKD